MDRAGRLASVTVVLFVFPIVAAANERYEEAFQWFGGLGFPEITADSEFVEVSTGAWYQSGGAEPKNTLIHGFLMSSDEKSFTVWTASWLNTGPDAIER